MLIPHGSGNPRQLEIPLSLIVTLLLAWTGVTFWGSYLSAQHIDYWRTQISNQVLTLKVKYLLHQIDQTRSMLDEVKQVDGKLRAMLKALDAKEQSVKKLPATEDDGTGGPSLADQDDVRRVLDQADPDITWKRLMEKANLLDSETEDRLSSYGNLVHWIDSQKNLFRAMPTGWPCDGHRTSGFGNRLSPFTGIQKFHTGVDIASTIGTPIRTTADGRVVLSNWESGYGNMIIIRHEFGFESRYAHCAKLLVKVGDYVKRGNSIALMGSTGSSSGPHCHYEVIQYGNFKNPFAYMIGQPLKNAPVVKLIKNELK